MSNCSPNDKSFVVLYSGKQNIHAKTSRCARSLKLVASGDNRWSYKKLGKDLGTSTSQLHLAVKRCIASRLMDVADARPNRTNIKEFLIHGVKYCFPAAYGGLTRGIPTGYAAPPLNKVIWPYAMGQVRGMMLSPIHKAAPEASLKDAKLYELLVLLDALRTGRAREREFAVRELSARIG
jgi:hypothetical protein